MKDLFNLIVNKKEISIDTSLNHEFVVDNQVIIFVTISPLQGRAIVIQGSGIDLEEAILDIRNKYENSKLKSEKFYGIKLDIVNDIKKTKRKIKLQNDTIKIKKGLEGIALDEKLKNAFQPTEIMAYQLISNSDKKLNLDMLKEALHHRLDMDINNTMNLFKTEKEIRLYTFTTKSYYYDEVNFYELYRGHRLFSNINKPDILDAIKLSQDNYFKNVINRKGKFIYIYQPHNDTSEKKYNILRHAGSVYSMLETFEVNPDKELLQQADRALKYLIKKQKKITVNGEKYRVIVERDIYKLGGNALAIVAMSKYTQITGDKKYLKNMQSMASWIKSTQNEQGEFTAHKQNYINGEVYDFISHFYPGEAILGLVRLYQVDKDETWLDVAEKAASFIIEIRDKDTEVDALRPDHWLMYALKDLYQFRQKSIYLEHCMLMAKVILNKQLTENTTFKENVGGFSPKKGKKPGITNNACWTEGLQNAYALAVDDGNIEFANRIKSAMIESVKFQLQAQLRPESVMHFENKSLCLGAFHKNLTNYELRNDLTQHNVSSLIGLYNIL